MSRSWKESLQEATDRLAGGMDEQRKAVLDAKEGNENMISSVRDSIHETARNADDTFKGLTSRFEEMRAEIGFSSGAQLEEQKKTNTGLDALSNLLGGLSEKMASVSDKVVEANREMSEFIQVVRDAREEEARRKTLDEARSHNDRGVALYFRKSYTGALEEFEKALGLDPTMAEAHSNMALCQSSLGKDEDAAASFKRALEIDPEMAEAYNNLGLLHFKKKDYEQALSLFQGAVKKREDYPNAYLNLGSAYKELAMHDKAVAAWEQVLKLDPGNPKAKEAIEEVRGA
jgi:tetratricopeptide (TPR) repeat protein